MDELKEILGAEKLLEAMIAWLPQDALDEIEADIRKEWNIDYEEEN